MAVFRLMISSTLVACYTGDELAPSPGPLFCATKPTSDRIVRRSKNERRMSELGHSRRSGFVRFRRHCGHEFLRQGRDGLRPDITAKLGILRDQIREL